MPMRFQTMFSPKSRLALSIGAAVLILLCGFNQSSRLFAQGGARENKVTPPAPVARAESKITTHPRVRARPNKKPLRQTANTAISLLIVSNPPGCKVAINSEPRGETDAKGELEVSLAPATYSLRLSREGYITSEGDVEITLALGPQQEVDFDLAPAVLTVNIVTDPAGAEVYLDDVYKGTSNSIGLLVLDRLNPGQPHKLRITKPGYTQQSDVPITTYSGQISIKLLPDSVRVKVNTDPSETEIYFDDIYKGSSTSDGVLMIDQVNPNQSHRLRGKKPGYIEQIRLLTPNSAEVSLKLMPDPVVLLVKETRQQIADANLVKAFDGYGQLVKDAPDQPELTRLLESLLQGLQLRSADTLKRIEPFGLVMDMSEIEEMKKLYDLARKWHPGDDTVETFGKYWDMKLVLVKADQTSSASEKEGLRRSAQSTLNDLGQRNLRNLYLLMEFGWAWLKLNDPTSAQKYFTAAQELKPDWAYSYFANALLAIQAGDREADKKVKMAKYGQAIDGFSKALSLKNDFARAYALRAIAYAYMKNYTEATASGLQATTVDPKSAYAHFALGFAYFQKGGKAAYRSARDEFERALALDGVELDQGTKNSIQERLAIIHKSIK
jgi:tetratricopeptide (TPR) repeat protein